MGAKVNGNRLAVQVSLSRKRGREAEPDRPLPAGEGFTGEGGTPPLRPVRRRACRSLLLSSAFPPFFHRTSLRAGVWHLAPES